MYHYKVCGLDNVWLENGYTEKDTRRGRAVAVADADQLHALLTQEVACKGGSLTGQEVRFLRSSMLLSQKSLGAMLGVSEQTVSLWERDQGGIPAAEDALLRLLALKNSSGQGDVVKVLERVNTVDRLVNQRIVAKAKNHKWTAKAEDEKSELTPA